MLKSLFNWKVLLNILLAVGVFTGLVYLTFRWLEYHTQHGQEIAVPNVMNKSVQEAIKIFDDTGLDYEVDSLQYDPKYKPFQVLKVSPIAGSHVKSGRTVKILVNPKTWAKVVVPDVLDRYKGLAFRQLEQVGLKVGDTIYEPSIQRDAVLRMMFEGNTLKPGTQLPRFSVIDLVIGTGPKRNIPIPNLVGLTIAQAKALITQNLFEVGIIEFEDGKGNETDIVYYQDPAAYDLRDQGMQIDLWASKKTPAELSGKISVLNSMFRVKIDTTLPPVRYYEEVPVLEETKPVPKSEQPTSPLPAAPKTTAPAATNNNNTTPKSSPAVTSSAKKPEPAVSANKDVKNTESKSVAPKTGTATTSPAEKPKAKKVID